MCRLTTAIVVSPIPTLSLDILAGRMFGPVLGTLDAALGAVLGALASFHIARFFGRVFLSRVLEDLFSMRSLLRHDDEMSAERSAEPPE